MKKTAERILLDYAYEIIADLECDCGMGDRRHKGNCLLMLKQKWIAKYDVAGFCDE